MSCSFIGSAYTEFLMINLSSLSSSQLKRAAAIKDRIETLQKELADLTGEAVETTSAPAGKRKISAAGLARIKAAQKKRWAKVNAGKPGRPAGKNKMSPAARAKIAAAAKARWAAAKASGRKKL
jgi:hypothetical protein